MKLLIGCFLLLSNFMGYGQSYKITREVNLNDSISVTDDVGKISFRIDDGKIYQLRVINKINDKYDLKITIFDLKSGNLLHCDTISGLPRYFNIQDFNVCKNQIVITGNEQFIHFDANDISKTLYSYPANLEYKNDTFPYKYCNYLNDSIVLLYTIYNYHPVDDRAGVYLRTFNIRTNSFEERLFMKFPGISITHIAGNWLTVLKNKIYILTPLTAKMFVLDAHLKILKTSTIDIFDNAELDSNSLYESQLDHTLDIETNRILSIAGKYNKDSIRSHSEEYHSDFYNKNYISKTINDVRQKHAYIAGLIPIDGSAFCIITSSPGYEQQKRNLNIYDVQKDKIIKRYNSLQCAHADSMVIAEDFFAINFSQGKLAMPYFIGNRIYYPSLYPGSLFHAGTYNDLSLKLLQTVKTSGYKWTMFEYQLD